MITLIEDGSHKGRSEMSVRGVVEEFHLTLYLLQTEDKAARDAALRPVATGSSLAG
jgi:hypothetical protein